MGVGWEGPECRGRGIGGGLGRGYQLTCGDDMVTPFSPTTLHADQIIPVSQIETIRFADNLNFSPSVFLAHLPRRARITSLQEQILCPQAEIPSPILTSCCLHRLLTS